MSRHDGAKAPATVPRAQEKAFTQHAVARLLQWLAAPADGSGTDPSVEAMQRNAAWAGFLMVPSTPEDKVVCDTQRAQWLPRLPLYVREPGPGFAPVMSRPSGPVSYVGGWPLALAKGLPAAGAWLAPGAVVLADTEAPDAEALHQGWRRWLQVFNTAQFLPGTLLATAAGLDAHDYEVLGALGAEASGPAKADDVAALDGAWKQVLEQCLGPLAEGLKALAQGGAALPEVGTELADDKGVVLADAELTWVTAKLAVLRADQEDLVGAWKAAGWSVTLLDESATAVEGNPWHVTVAERLDLTLQQNKE
jgi:DEAD/DEAH box helicase domain-containing protein